MIKPTKLNAVLLAVRDLQKSLDWYKEHFGFEKLYDVPGGVLIGADGVEVVLSPVDKPQEAKCPDKAKDICIKLFAFEVSADELACVESEYAEDRNIVRIDHPRFQSRIISDPDGHAIELYVDKAV
jgi:catechol-2,3-dioxygenase